MKKNQELVAQLCPCPKSGSGVHSWIFKTARHLHRLSLNENDQHEIIEHMVQGCGREVPAEEIDSAIRNSHPDRMQQGQWNTPRWPSANPELIYQVAQKGPNLAELEKMSPVKWSDDQPHTEEIINALFPSDALICAGLRNNQALTRSREQWRGFLHNQQFIVPSPMTSVYGKTQEGNTSMRSNSNVGPRRFIICEFDSGNFDDHSARLIELSKYAPLSLVVHSGRRSAHGWFYVAGAPTEAVEAFFKYACTLGADPATWTPSQYVRMPSGRRDTGVRQRVLFFNPRALEIV